MIKAFVKLKNHQVNTVYCGSFSELFEKIKDLEVESLDAKVISAREMRQGRCNSLPTFGR